MARLQANYLTRSRYGIWYYQRVIPLRMRSPDSNLGALFKLSLRTCDNEKAFRMARAMSVKIDRLALQYFSDAKGFAKAMELLHQSLVAESQSKSFEDYERSFLLEMDESDEYYLSKAKSFAHSIEAQYGELQQRLDELQELLSLHSKMPNGQADELREALKEIVSPKIPDDQNPTLEELLQEWCANRENVIGARSLKQGYLPAVEFFIRVIKDLTPDRTRINQLTVEHIQHYQKVFAAIPVHSKIKGVPIAELVKRTGSKKSPNTIAQNFTNVGTFLHWVKNRGHPISEKVIDVLTRGSGVVVTAKSRKQRKPLNQEHLSKLFNSERYRTGEFKTSAEYWAPLIALFTGARMSEILQLEHADIKKDGNVWIIEISDLDPTSKDEMKHVKLDGSRREVPIHSQLITLGFLKYVEMRKGERLFPDAERDRHGKFDATQKRFARLRQKLGIVPENSKEMLDFHSFRHLVETELNEKRFDGKSRQRYDSGIIDSIIGHQSKGRGIGQARYNHAQLTNIKLTAIQVLDYPCIDFGQMARWDQCRFYRDQVRKKAGIK